MYRTAAQRLPWGGQLVAQGAGEKMDFFDCQSERALLRARRVNGL